MKSPSVASLPLYRAEQVRELDRRAIEEHGIPGYTLMCRAAAAALKLLRQRFPEAQCITVLCGAGNNAGDGYVLARLAQDEGLTVVVQALSDPHKLQGDAATAHRDAVAAGVEIKPWGDALAPADVIVDALLGTGLGRPVEGDYRAAIEAINASAAQVLALDIPSGLHANTGAVSGVAVQADICITFIAAKLGLYTGRGVALCGELIYDDLQVPPSVFQAMEPAAWRYAGEDLPALLPPRPRDAHKGHHGHVLVIGGERGTGGAVRLAAEAAARVGAGLVSVATREEHLTALLATRPELMVHGVEQGNALDPLLERASVVVIGPGLGQGHWGRSLLSRVLQTRLPTVVDADALNLLAGSHLRREDWLLTPHPGEAARLLDTDSATVQQDRFAAAMALRQCHGGHWVLKGSGSIVVGPGQTWVIQGGNPGMASGGMGDVLSGVLGGLLAQGLDLTSTARLGSYLHAQAADLAAQQGERGLLASDLFQPLRQLANPPSGAQHVANAT